jgi:hypothetical protein
MGLFAHRFTTAASSRGDLHGVKTAADIDRPDAMTQSTRADVDRPRLLDTKTAAVEDKDDHRGALAGSHW